MSIRGGVLAATLALSAIPIAYTACSAPMTAKTADGLGSSNGSSEPPIPTSDLAVQNIVVDQLGYRPNDPKFAVVRNPKVGYDSADAFAPGAAYQVIRVSDGAAVYSGTIAQWNGGATQASSGDQGWWFDFSSVTGVGAYYVLDVAANKRSAPFKIASDVYRDALKAATKFYYYQRSGTAKVTPYADACWTDTASYMRADQDPGARDITDRTNAAKAAELSGGWYDAGDTNKYVTFTFSPVNQLLTAYQEAPTAFGDDFNIPESGNGVPDVIDEVKWEIDWLKKMQNADGSAKLKLGAIDYATIQSPYSTDATPRYYIPKCTSATIATAAMFAHASYVFAGIPALQSEAADLKTRAIDAWNNYQAAPTQETNCDDLEIKAADSDWPADEQDGVAVVAAIYLYAITNSGAYDAYVQNNYLKLHMFSDVGYTRYEPAQGEAALFYATLAGADAATKAALRQRKTDDISWDAGDKALYGTSATADLYRAYMHDPQYHWGSNMVRANYGNSNVDVATYGFAATTTDYLTRALDTLHYFHGVNPFGMVYLTNMYRYGVTKSANSIYHGWYQAGTKWSHALNDECGPPPGYVPGGPNASAEADGVPTSLAPPTGQPAQKSYRDWNGGWPEDSWTITEPGLYYQASYVKLLSKFAQP